MTPRQRRAAIAWGVAVVATWWPSDLSAQDGFAFAGLSRRTTVEEARKRYPNSSISGTHVYISQSDSHDHIYAIDIPTGGGDRRLRVFFERQGSRGPIYPACDKVLNAIKAQHGEPVRVQDFDEERARNRRFIWQRGGEELSLLCFRVGRRLDSASDLTIAALH